VLREFPCSQRDDSVPIGPPNVYERGSREEQRRTSGVASLKRVYQNMETTGAGYKAPAVSLAV
jgi:hypothetical protein